VRNWFQAFALKCNLYRYNAVLLSLLGGGDTGGGGDGGSGHGHSHGGAGELGRRAMFLHVLGDTAGTLVVAAGGGLVWGMNGGAVQVECSLP
jgi:Co/Zn/Cd efflux system component